MPVGIPPQGSSPRAWGLFKILKLYIVTTVEGNRHHAATKEEVRQIQRCKDQAMVAVGAKNMFTVHVNPARRIRFYETLNDIYQQQYGWDQTYTLLEIKPLDVDEISKYQSIDPEPQKVRLNYSIKSAVIAYLRAECEQADQQALDE